MIAFLILKGLSKNSIVCQLVIKLTFINISAYISMGKEKVELNENKLSNQSDHSPMREAEHDDERVPLDSNGEKKAMIIGGNNIPNGKGGR